MVQSSIRKISVSGFLFLLLFSVVPLVSSSNVEPSVTISEVDRGFRIGSSPINQSGRIDHVMSYDSESDVTIIFGGIDYDSPNRGGQTWAYDLNTDSYFNMSPTVAPPIRVAAGIAYDVQSDRLVLFGGLLGLESTTASDSTWTYDYNMNNWTEVSPTFAPSPRFAASMTYDSESDRVILFGGVSISAGVEYNDTWAFDLETNTWEEMNPSSAPAARYGAAITYDIEEDRVLLFGGNPSRITTTNTFSDTWEYDYNTDRWVDLDPVVHPSNRYATKMVYSSESNLTVLFGGYPDTSGKYSTWVYDHNGNNWTQWNDDPHPSGRFRHAIVYDSESDLVVMFGGMTGDWNSEQVIKTDTTWTYDVNVHHWTQMGGTPNPTTSTTPTTPATTEPVFPTAAMVAVVIITGLAMVIIVMVARGVIFPKYDGVKGES